MGYDTVPLELIDLDHSLHQCLTGNIKSRRFAGNPLKKWRCFADHFWKISQTVWGGSRGSKGQGSNPKNRINENCNCCLDTFGWKMSEKGHFEGKGISDSNLQSLLLDGTFTEIWRTTTCDRYETRGLYSEINKEFLRIAGCFPWAFGIYLVHLAKKSLLTSTLPSLHRCTKVILLKWFWWSRIAGSFTRK